MGRRRCQRLAVAAALAASALAATLAAAALAAATLAAAAAAATASRRDVCSRPHDVLCRRRRRELL